MISSVKPNFLSDSSELFPNFAPRTEVSTLFLEHDNHLLLLMRSHKEDQSGAWGVPGGKAEKNETATETLLRELQEETQITLAPENVTYLGHRYARIPGWDYLLHIYHATLQDRPAVMLDPNEHCRYEWVSIYAFKLMPLLKGQDEAFDIVYQDRLWQKIDVTQSPQLQQIDKVAQIALKKGQQVLLFDATRRFVLNLIGTSGSGKGTQGTMLSQLFGVPNVSAGDIFRDEFRANSKLGWMVQIFDEKHYPSYLPDEIPIGMMTKRLANRDCENGFILDGFPRTEQQGTVTREILLQKNDFHVPLFMDVPEADIWDRLPGRLICTGCGHQVREFDENSTRDYCPKDGQKLEPRIEDIDKTKTERRLKMFADNREHILQSMQLRDPVTTFSLDNSTPPKEVLHLLCSEIQNRLDQWAQSQNPSAIVSLLKKVIL